MVAQDIPRQREVLRMRVVFQKVIVPPELTPQTVKVFQTLLNPVGAPSPLALEEYLRVGATTVEIVVANTVFLEVPLPGSPYVFWRFSSDL